MLRYRLDDLGWYQFEWLVQAVLKDQLGLGVESWGGHGDHGRDAWCPSPLSFPSKGPITDGPFLFQVKFIEGANAAGARPTDRLISATKAELKKIVERKAISTLRGDKECAHYALITNSSISPQAREKIIGLIQAALPQATIHLFSGTDVCDMLDLNLGLRRSFPQLLSLRDLDAILADVVDRTILQKSAAAIAEARDIVDVFVPTETYAQAWEVLRKHRFVVLEGPPEMGKTAIAWMISLAQIANGWEAIVCDSPDDFFGAFRPDHSQVFIADDAFGRGEYEPTRGANWEAQLHRVFSRLGNTHWLVWTSRKLILERARQHMDLQGLATGFPRPGEVLVDASKLTAREKALILYRHAKHALSDKRLKDFIRQNALSIVSHDAFTPERIRRFVVEAMPQLSGAIKSNSANTALVESVSKEISNPTDRMRKSFQCLSVDHKWMLLSLLESGYLCSVEDLFHAFRIQCPHASANPEHVLEELTEAFVRLKGPKMGRYVEWIHPSYRDLVIEQLRNGGSLKAEFLEHMGTPGISLALSDTGGAGGTLRFPLLTGKDDWSVLKRRCIEIASSARPEEGADDLLTILTNAYDEASKGQEKDVLITTLCELCTIIRDRWDTEGAELGAAHINMFVEATVRISPIQQLPRLDRSWAAAVTKLEAQLRRLDSDFMFDMSGLDELLALADAISTCEPRFLRQVAFPASLMSLWELLLERVDHELSASRDYSSVEWYDSEADASHSLATSIRKLIMMVPGLAEGAKPRIDRLVAHANWCRERFDEESNEPYSADDSSDTEPRLSRSSDVLDICEIFIDL